MHMIMEYSFNQFIYTYRQSSLPFSDDDYTVAFTDAGAVAYFSGWNLLDIDGLNDKFIAEHGVN